MNIWVIWSGYVWLTHGTCLADLGNYVTCIDIDIDKISKLQQGIIPIYEPWLEELVHNNIKAGRLRFASDLTNYSTERDIVFIAVGTPSGKDGHADLQYIKSAATKIGQHIDHYIAIVNKSTVPVGTGNMVKHIINDQLKQRSLNIDFDVVSNPEFLKEGSAVEDFKYGERIVIGCDNKDSKAVNLLEQLYAPLTHTKILKTNLQTAEIIKYGANALLAVEISFINKLAQLCELVWADITQVSEGLKLDSRIGKKAFLNAWPGFGWSCFPKDVLELSQTFKDFQIPNTLLESTLQINDEQKLSIISKIKKLVPNLKWKTVGILGLAFKANTDDIRYSSAITLIDQLQALDVMIQAYDPKAMQNFARFYPTIQYCDNLYQATNKADVLVVLTDWDEFKQPDWHQIKTLMNQFHIVDMRNIYDANILKILWFDCIQIGK